MSELKLEHKRKVLPALEIVFTDSTTGKSHYYWLGAFPGVTVGETLVVRELKNRDGIPRLRIAKADGKIVQRAQRPTTDHMVLLAEHRSRIGAQQRARSAARVIAKDRGWSAKP